MAAANTSSIIGFNIRNNLSGITNDDLVRDLSEIRKISECPTENDTQLGEFNITSQNVMFNLVITGKVFYTNWEDLFRGEGKLLSKGDQIIRKCKRLFYNTSGGTKRKANQQSISDLPNNVYVHFLWILMKIVHNIIVRHKNSTIPPIMLEGLKNINTFMTRCDEACLTGIISNIDGSYFHSFYKKYEQYVNDLGIQDIIRDNPPRSNICTISNSAVSIAIGKYLKESIIIPFATNMPMTFTMGTQNKLMCKHGERCYRKRTQIGTPDKHYHESNQIGSSRKKGGKRRIRKTRKHRK